MEKNYKVNDDLTLEMDGKVYRLTKNNLHDCTHCPLYKIRWCDKLCYATYYRAAETPSFGYNDAIFVEVTENKETAMEEKEPKNEPNYKSLYEQEHKKYGDAVERMKSWMNGEHPECFSEAQKAAEFVFPELKESEDERIKKEIISLIKETHVTDRYYDLNKMLAWLEKRKEQKPVEWTKEAVVDALTDELTARITPLHKKALAKTITEKEDMYMAACVELRSYVNSSNFQIGKPVWSEEDEVMLGNALWACKEKYCSTETYNWLKSLKERMTLTNKNDFDRGYEVGISAAKFNQWKPTEEQMSYLASAIEQIDFCNPEHAALEAIYTHFKKL